MNRLRQRLIFERFLVRVFAILGESAILKGGVVLELRLSRARATKDVDLRCMGSPRALLEQLRSAGRQDEGDHLFFEVNLAPGGDTIAGEGIIYEGRRFQVEARLAGKRYGDPFGVDAGFGDTLTGEVEQLEGSDLLSFADIPRSRLRVYPRETHVAEKLHAYTLPRELENSRVKDLPDIALLAQTGRFNREILRAALERTFAFRGTHQLPGSMPPPLTSWTDRYARMAQDHGLPWPTLADVHRAASAFLDPILGGGGEKWSPERWTWE
ncbi:nucleotidyl transferase AbiEii/AbiGii toxin family protein [Archangium violaceum]|uniref:nucleotidyl transferase AbiEii/AbiGii toxin family protein n=1 Tax=Archangium violaceum TaxID=83451 RepID=UPI001EF65D90|nr:nucleotidyl transferase AbiEii/AbiGii toxin family protein [Archangium violaceum]